MEPEVLPEKELAIQAKRKANEDNWSTIEAHLRNKKLVVLICPTCEKPNRYGATECTSCNFALSKYDSQVSESNVFLDIVSGKDVPGTNILLRSDKAISFDDKYPISQMHIDVIPVEIIKDISELTEKHIPLLKELYQCALDSLKLKKNPMFEDKNIEDYLIVGFNYPVTIEQLHLHAALPPYAHTNVWQYPRFHSLQKVLDDLARHKKVLTYDVTENKEEWQKTYDFAMKANSALLAESEKKSAALPVDDGPEQIVVDESKESSTTTPRLTPKEEYDAWIAKKDNKACGLVWKAYDAEAFEIDFKLGNYSFKLRCPSLSSSEEEMYFLEGEENWMNDVNEWFFSGEMEKLTLSLVLSKIVELSAIKKTLNLSDSGAQILREDIEPDSFQDAQTFGIGIDWSQRPPDSWLARTVLREISVVDSMLPGAITTTGLGFVELTIDITDSLSKQMAQVLELRLEPCVVSFDFAQMWAIREGEKVPFPGIKVRQYVSSNDNEFGVAFHLREIVMRFMDDHYTWSTTAKMHSPLGAFQHDKGLGNTNSIFPSLGTNQSSGSKEGNIEEDKKVKKLMGMGFKRDMCEKALVYSKNRYNTALDWLISEGENAIDFGAQKPSSKSDESGGNSVEIDADNVEQLMNMGFSRQQSRRALQKTKNNLEDSLSLLLDGADLPADEEEGKPEPEKRGSMDQKAHTKAGEKLYTLSRYDNINFFMALIGYMKMRLKNYFRYCLICHKKHSCKSEKPVVCCNPLCIFRYTEIFPTSKKQKMSEVDRVIICPFTDCDCLARADYKEEMNSLFSGLRGVKEKENEENQQQMLSMLSHRYLTNSDVLKFINEGVKASGVKIDKIENVLKPELVTAFEARWNQMTKQLGKNLTVPSIAYHGTAEANINSILEKGLLVPGKGAGKDVGHATDNGWWGGGIYLSPDHSLSIGYCGGGRKLLICSVIMGRRYRVTERMDGGDLVEGYDSHVAEEGKEWVIFEPSQVLPCYLVSFVPGHGGM